MSRVARLGAFIFITLAILSAAVFIIGSKQYLFRSTYQLRAEFDNVAGLASGADVRVGGVHSGTVRSITLPHRPGEEIMVVMDMDKSTREIIKHDSLASIETEGVLGYQYLAISFGSAGQAEVRDGEIITTEPPLVIADLFKKASGILDSSQLTINNATIATAHLNSVSAKIDSGQGTVGALVNDKQLYSHLENATATLQDTAQQAKIGVTDFQENMEALKHNFLLRGYFKKRGYEDSSDLGANKISMLPRDAPLRTFSFSSRKLFDSQDSARLKNQNSLDAVGEYLAQNQFAFAVIAVSAGTTGDTSKELLLTEARAMVIREYLVEKFAFDDRQLKTLGLGKQTESSSKPNENADWGSIQILIFPTGTVMPTEKKATATVTPRISSNTPAHIPEDLTPNP